MASLNTTRLNFLLLLVLLLSTGVFASGDVKHDQSLSEYAGQELHAVQHETQAQEQLEISKAYVRGLPPGQKTTAAFFTIKNITDNVLTLKKLSTPNAEKAEMHETQEQAGQMQMRKLDALTIKPGETVVFEPNGKHIMLMGLTLPLKEGELITLRLCFGEFCRMLKLPVVSVLNEAPPLHDHKHN